MKQLSIIVPIYNVEPYLERCLRSLEEQDISRDEYEIICINDGSPDNSRNIVVSLQKEFENIILIDQENQGVSRARNNGIDKACGRYLLFIDADDYCEVNLLNPLLKNIAEQNAQVSFLSFVVLNADGSVNEKTLYQNDGEQKYRGIDAYYVSRNVGSSVPDRMTGVLFERSFIDNNNLRYLPDVPYLEDGEFIARILCLAESCIFDKSLFLIGTTRSDSASSSQNFHLEKAINGFILAAGNLKKFQRTEKLDGNQKEFLNQPIVKYVLLAINSSTGWSSFRRLIQTIRILRKSDFRKLKIEGCNQYYSFLGKVYNLSPGLSAVALILYPTLRRLSQVIKK